MSLHLATECVISFRVGDVPQLSFLTEEELETMVVSDNGTALSSTSTQASVEIQDILTRLLSLTVEADKEMVAHHSTTEETPMMTQDLTVTTTAVEAVETVEATAVAPSVKPAKKAKLADGVKRGRTFSRKLLPSVDAILAARTEGKTIAQLATEYHVAPIDIRLVISAHGTASV